MKFPIEHPERRRRSPTPHGVGGLKFSDELMPVQVINVPPRTGWVD